MVRGTQTRYVARLLVNSGMCTYATDLNLVKFRTEFRREQAGGCVRAVPDRD
eukprot:SAG22_NODE_66_length_22936_cov_626.714279_11_plen_52_part_00